MKKPFLKAGYCGIILIIVSVVLLYVNPSKAGKLPRGFFNPVVAFEFIRTEAEVYDLFGGMGSVGHDKVVSGMVTGTYIDFLYMAVYTLFLLIFAEVCRRITGSKWFLFSGFIAICILISDFGENLQLLSIMSKLQSEDFGRNLSLLNFYTWAKWGGLSALFISLVPFLRKSGFSGRIISVTSLISAVIGSAAFLNRSALNEIYVLSIAVIFIMLIIFSFTFILAEENK